MNSTQALISCLAARRALFILLAVAHSSCSTVEKNGRAVALPRLAVEGVNFNDGLKKKEAATLSVVYFRRFVSGCGEPDDPQEDGQYWRVRLWSGFNPSDAGTLRFAKDGSEVLLSPPKGGFGAITQLLLERANLIHDQLPGTHSPLSPPSSSAGAPR